jgi:hypothetical protein
VVADELMGMPPGELFDEAGELEIDCIPNAGAETRPGGGAATRLEDEKEDDCDDDALESSDPEAGWPAWLSLAVRPLPPLKPIDPGMRAGDAVVWPESGSVDESPP